METSIVNIFSKRPFIKHNLCDPVAIKIQRTWHMPVFLMFLGGGGDGISIHYCKMAVDWNIYIWGILIKEERYSGNSVFSSAS